MRFLLVGNYGARNVGDDALKHYFLTRFPEIEWAVLSARPGSGEYPRLPLGMRSLLATPWWKTLSAYAHADGLVFGGGSLFTDSESAFACVLWALHAWVARLFRVPVHLAFQGIGPFRSWLARACARSVLRRARFVSVRDALSASTVRSLAPNTKMIQSFDPVFSLNVEQKGPDRSQKIFSIIPRGNSQESFIRRAEELATEGGFSGMQILTLEASAADRSMGERLQRALAATVHPVSDWGELLNRVAGSTLVLTERFHGALAAVRLGVPVEIIAHTPGDKLDALQRRLRESSASEISTQFLSEVRVGEQALRSALQSQS
ncbi:polysaccharide pyruvyl transferase family protein [Candidatus Peregrinibacteria bacterium]|nr:polysaccharide pyruvyl transferase family protein [Candidatus Peregrinibacteria bacterium]